MKFFAIFSALLFSISFQAQGLDLDTQKSTVKWIGKKVTGQHDGNVNIKSGSVDFDKKGTLKSGTFTIDMNTITNNDVESPKWRKEESEEK